MGVTVYPVWAKIKAVHVRIVPDLARGSFQHGWFLNTDVIVAQDYKYLRIFRPEFLFQGEEFFYQKLIHEVFVRYVHSADLSYAGRQQVTSQKHRGRTLLSDQIKQLEITAGIAVQIGHEETGFQFWTSSK